MRGGGMMRVAAMSDLHGHTGFEVPKCEVLIVGGDICRDGYKKMWLRSNPSLYQEVMDRDFFNWLGPYVDGGHIGAVLYTWGNHDWTQGVTIRNPPGFFPLVDDSIILEGVKFWGSPWSNTFMDWAWMKDPKELKEVYAKIPDDVDVIISHGPPLFCGDRLPDGVHVGSEELLEVIDRVKPSGVVTGHIHCGRGVFTRGDTNIYNASVVDEGYRRVHDPLEFMIIKGKG